MSDSDAPTSSASSSSGTAWLLGIIGSLILYLLSPGLFVLFHNLGSSPPAWLNYAMLPIGWACQEFPFVSGLYDLYLSFLGAPV